MSEDCDIIEPSAAEQYLWPEATQNYVRDLEARIEELEGLAQALIDDVRERHPGEKLRCPHMIALNEALKGTNDD